MTEKPRDDDHATETEDDSQSDPALDDTAGNDWEGEGGATPAGPATDTESS